MSELAKRIAVAVVGIPAVLALAYLGGWFLAVPLAVLAAIGVLELFRMGHAAGVRPVAPLGVGGAMAFVLLAAWRPAPGAFAPWALGVVVALVFLALLAALFVQGPGGRPLGAASLTLLAPVYVGLPLAAVPLLLALPEMRAWSATDAERWGGLAVVALPLAATWIGDASAYFAGSAWGSRKLAPAISPNKSWVGFWAELVGGAVAGATWLLVAGRWLPGLGLGVAWVGLLGAVLGLAAVVGDLVESLFKRDAGVKDSGTFFPGHGGMLDRLDALLFTLPVAYVALVLLGGRP